VNQAAARFPIYGAPPVYPRASIRWHGGPHRPDLKPGWYLAVMPDAWTADSHGPFPSRADAQQAAAALGLTAPD
jgi:hypothetical protein